MAIAKYTNAGLPKNHLSYLVICRKKAIRNEPEAQKKIREQSVRKDFESEIELQFLRSEQHRERCQTIDTSIHGIISDKAQGQVAKLLKQWWSEQTSRNEAIFQRRWKKNEQWFAECAESFKLEFKNKSPFFKIKEKMGTQTSS